MPATLSLAGTPALASGPELAARAGMTAASPLRRLAPWCALLALLGGYLLAADGLLGTWGDNAHYMIVARAIAEGAGLRDVHTPGAPPFAYPAPLFPALLSLAVGAWGYAIAPLERLVALSGALAVLLAWRLWRELDEPAPFLLALAAGFSPHVVAFAHDVMSELPYLALSLVALLFVARVHRLDAAGDARRGAGATLLLCLCAAATIAAWLTRTIGVALVAGVVLSLLVDGTAPARTRLRRAAGVAVACALAWLVANADVVRGMAYIAEFERGTASQGAGTDYAARIAANLEAYAVAVPEVVLPWLHERPAPLVAALVLLLVTGGFVAHLATRRRSVVDWYVLAYAALLLAYEPSNGGNVRRYLVPLVPFIVRYALAGVIAIVGAVRAGRARSGNAEATMHAPRSPVAAVATVAVGLVLLSHTVATRWVRPGTGIFDYYRFDDWPALMRLARWTGDHTPRGSVVATRMPYLFHVWADRPVTWLPPGEQGADAMLRAVDSLGIRYLALDAMRTGRLAAHDSVTAIALRDTARFRPVLRDGRHLVVEVRPKAVATRHAAPASTADPVE